MRLGNDVRTQQRGNATVMAVIVAGVVAAVGFYVRMNTENSMAALSVEEQRLGARLNNEAALELVGALAANHVIVRQGNGLVLGQGARNLQHGPDRIWRLVGNRRLIINTCSQFMGADSAASLYGTTNDANPAAAGCMGREREQTPVVVDEVIGNEYVVFKATSRLKFRSSGGGSSQVVTRAQVRVAAFDELIPHTGCGFMEPMKGGDGSALYYPDGKLILRPSRTWAAVQPLAYDSTFYGDPNSPNLRALRGVLDGYLRQGYTSMRTIESSFDVSDNVPVEPQFNKAAGKYQKFVYYLAGYRSGLGAWPAEGIRNARLKSGCQRTIGDASPDFCTRVDVLAKSTTFRFEAKHNCGGSGSAATGYTFGCPATPIAPVDATSHDHWACMYFSYHDVMKPGECKRQFRGYCRNGDGCFAPTTKIKLKNGSEKRINELVVGDEVWTLAGRAAKVQTMIVGPEAKPLYEVGIRDRTVKVTDTHPFKTRAGLKTAAALAASDELLGEDGLYHRLTTLRQLPVDDEQMVWNVRLDAEPGDTLGHVMIADGVPAGDLHLQNQAQGETQSLKMALDLHYGP